MNDKHDEPPQVTNGYGVSVAYSCLVDTIRAIQIEIRPDIHQPVTSLQPSTTLCENDDRKQANCIDPLVSTLSEDNNDVLEKSSEAKRSPLHKQIINSSWCGLLSALCPLIESWCVSVLLKYVF